MNWRDRRQLTAHCECCGLSGFSRDTERTGDMSTFLSLSLSLGQGLSLYLSISISLCLYMEIIVGIGLCGYGGREVPQWIMYVLKSQESLVSSGPSQKAWEPEVGSISPRVWRPNNQVLQRPKAGEDGPAALEDRGNSPFLGLFVVFRPSRNWMMPPTWVRTIFLTQFSDSMLISSRNTLKVPPRNNVTCSVGIPQPNQVDT